MVGKANCMNLVENKHLLMLVAKKKSTNKEF